MTNAPAQAQAPMPAQAPIQNPPAPLGLDFEGMIQNVGELGPPKSMAVLGKFKIGKTWLAASSCKVPFLVGGGKEVLIIEAESGTASIASDFPEVKQVKFSNLAQINLAVDQLCTRAHNYGVVIVDTVDKIQQDVVTPAMLASDPGNSQRAYGQVKLWTNDFLWKLHEAPFLTIFLFHEEDVADASGSGLITTTFKMTGSAKDTAGQVFDIIARLEIENDNDGAPRRALQLGMKVKNVTGNRYEKFLPNRMPEPTMAKIYEAIEPVLSQSNNK